LTVLELATLGAVYMLKLVIDFLKEAVSLQTSSSEQGLQLFLWFTGFRVI
jgi:hypothetical protein